MPFIIRQSQYSQNVAVIEIVCMCVCTVTCSNYIYCSLFFPVTLCRALHCVMRNYCVDEGVKRVLACVAVCLMWAAEIKVRCRVKTKCYCHPSAAVRRTSVRVSCCAVQLSALNTLVTNKVTTLGLSLDYGEDMQYFSFYCAQLTGISYYIAYYEFSTMWLSLSFFMFVCSIFFHCMLTFIAYERLLH